MLISSRQADCKFAFDKTEVKGFMGNFIESHHKAIPIMGMGEALIEQLKKTDGDNEQIAYLEKQLAVFQDHWLQVDEMLAECEVPDETH